MANGRVLLDLLKYVLIPRTEWLWSRVPRRLLYALDVGNCQIFDVKSVVNIRFAAAMLVVKACGVHGPPAKVV